MIKLKHDKIASWQKTTGKVVGYSTKDSEGSTSHSPDVEYMDDRGERHTYNPERYSGDKTPFLGTIVHISYDPKNPSIAVGEGFSERYMMLTLGIIVGVGVMLIGGLILLAPG